MKTLFRYLVFLFVCVVIPCLLVLDAVNSIQRGWMFVPVGRRTEMELYGAMMYTGVAIYFIAALGIVLSSMPLYNRRFQFLEETLVNKVRDAGFYCVLGAIGLYIVLIGWKLVQSVL